MLTDRFEITISHEVVEMIADEKNRTQQRIIYTSPRLKTVATIVRCELPENIYLDGVYETIERALKQIKVHFEHMSKSELLDYLLRTKNENPWDYGGRRN